MIRLFLLLAVTAFLSPVARAAEPTNSPDMNCNGDVSGAVTGQFNCTMTVKREGKVVSFTVKPDGTPKGLKSFAPVTFVIKNPITVQTYTHRDLVKASLSMVTQAGKKYHSSGDVADRGDIEVEVISVEHQRGINIGMMRVHAHLVPAAAKDESEIQLNLNVLTNW
ncbi:MAG: hypothetical protein WCK73_07335 [Deltaproteobacteria bacterium]